MLKSTCTNSGDRSVPMSSTKSARAHQAEPLKRVIERVAYEEPDTEHIEVVSDEPTKDDNDAINPVEDEEFALALRETKDSEFQEKMAERFNYQTELCKFTLAASFFCTLDRNSSKIARKVGNEVTRFKMLSLEEKIAYTIKNQVKLTPLGNLRMHLEDTPEEAEVRERVFLQEVAFFIRDRCKRTENAIAYTTHNHLCQGVARLGDLSHAYMMKETYKIGVDILGALKFQKMAYYRPNLRRFVLNRNTLKTCTNVLSVERKDYAKEAKL